ncbi:Bestrophin, RFP-TM, chloride channel-domain-containing protein [Gigaspora rosea]|uniref:Bestrophin, RFP-TM, chloride channel-domain-containing protein n=1 Tax=Gigaspora rosea TaxID=44941 RepID=A0A397VZC2_9GLOM|nr:Bestrophin, RFP-TM, chloride channel-domain-containing protein [Gigaspora rosea]
MDALSNLLDDIKRLFSLLLAIKIAFLYAILNSIISAIITVLYMTTDIKLSFKQDFITLISFIVSLLISARASNAYNRYLEGQSLWTKVRITILNLAGFIRINIDNKEQIEQYTSFLLYFIITIKDFLLIDKIRDAGIKIKIEEINNTSDDGVKIDVEETKKKEKLKMKEIIQNINDCDRKEVRNLKQNALRKKKKGLRKRLHQIILKLNLFINELGKIEKNKQEKMEGQEKKGKEETVSYDKIRDGILTLSECFSDLEMIDESIPFVYSTLLSLTTWIYSLSLSFQLVSDLEWLTVPIIFLSTLFLFGIIELSKQLENPFGIDINDLDLNKFCKGIWKDTIFIITDKGEQISNVKIEEIIKDFKQLTGPTNNETKDKSM